MIQIFKNFLYTKGFNRTLIFDTLNANIHFMPNELYDFLVSNKFKIDDDNIEILEFFENLNMTFSVKEKLKNNFSVMNKSFKQPYEILVSVIELSSFNSKSIYKLISKNNNGKICQFNFILSNYSSLESIKIMLQFINECESDSFELTILQSFKFYDEVYDMIKTTKKIITINNYSEEKINKFGNDAANNRFINNTDTFNLKICRDVQTFFESEHHHVYYNNKIFIGKNGEIKNTVECDYVFGNINKLKTIDFSKIKSNKNFTKYWNTKKKDTMICQMCEFRNLCVDNRLPLIDNKNWYHEKECEYNPFISKWDFEEGYYNLENTKVKIQKNKLFIDKDYIESLNYKLWNV